MKSYEEAIAKLKKKLVKVKAMQACSKDLRKNVVTMEADKEKIYRVGTRS